MADRKWTRQPFSAGSIFPTEGGLGATLSEHFERPLKHDASVSSSGRQFHFLAESGTNEWSMDVVGQDGGYSNNNLDECDKVLLATTSGDLNSK